MIRNIRAVERKKTRHPNYSNYTVIKELIIIFVFGYLDRFILNIPNLLDEPLSLVMKLKRYVIGM